jgi:signal transduction histidine kinase/CheY-like chemotaxis protein
MVGLAVPLEPGASRVWRYGVAATMFSALVMGALVFYSRGLGRIEGYLPRGECYLWQPPLVLLHAVSDAAIAAAFVSISVTLAYLVRGARSDIPFDWMILAFGGFIIACGATHAMEVWTLWRGNYWFSGGIKLFTAAVSVTTAIALPPLVPRIQALVRADSLARDRELRLVEERAVRAEIEAARAEAEEANRAKDQFLATISHELRNPLSPILAWARMLRLGQVDPQKTRRAVEVIERNAAMLAQLIDDLLDVSRIVSGKLRLDMRPMELAPILEATVEAVRPAAEARQVELHASLDATHARILGDPARLQQVAWNLLTNAVKFTARGGRIDVSLVEHPDGRVEFRVSDDGIGIPSRALPHIFDRFWQAEGHASEQRQGLGLGLAIVRHVTELHGGIVAVHSDGDGRGTSFTVTLPRCIIGEPPPQMLPGAAGTVARAPSVPFPRLDGRRILVVDDDPDTSELLKTLLGTCGAEVRVAGSSAQAIEILDRWIPDVLVSDIGLPGEDGYSLMRRVRSRLPAGGGNVPAVALTAHAREEDRLLALEAGFQRHVPKPPDPTQLVSVVADLMVWR